MKRTRRLSAVRQTRHVTEEIALGGNFADAVRVGDTVRRRAGPWTPAVHALLRHLEAVGFEGSPRVVGVDEQGREVLTYIDGDGPQGWPDPMPEYVWRDANLIAAARLLRRYHDAQAGFTPPVPASWRWPSEAAEVICHNDIAPFNSVFRDGKLVAMVDFDSAGPGRRIWDVAMGISRWVPIHKESGPAVRDRPARVRLFCDAYGLGPERKDVIDVLVDRQKAGREFVRGEAARGDPGAAKIWSWFPNDSFLLDAIAYVEAHRDELSRDL
jgi:hypothetical protein